MRVGVQVRAGASFADLADRVAAYEAAGVAVVSVAEAYSFDAVSQLGYLAARTSRIALRSGILPIYSRTPALLGMTAAGLDYVSNGRFELGLGASGPQVVEGFHGVPYDAPLARTREVIEVCRAVWRREKLEHRGRHYEVPLPAGRGTGLGKPLKLIDHPVRDRIPVSIAAIGPRNVELAAEIAEGWEPIFFHPQRASEIWGPALAAGTARREAALGDLDVVAGVPCACTSDPEPYLKQLRSQLALYIGGMGSAQRNFYFDLAVRYGYAGEAAAIQENYLAGRVADATRAVPLSLCEAVSLVGSPADLAGKVDAFRAAGVTTLMLQPMSADPADAVEVVSMVTAHAASAAVPGPR